MIQFGDFGCKTDGNGNAGLMLSLCSRHGSKVTMQSGRDLHSFLFQLKCKPFVLEPAEVIPLHNSKML